VLRRHVLPNSTGPVLVLATLQFGVAILTVSALSFLGYGAQPPTPEWGSLVAGGRDFLRSSWWLTTMPGLTVALTVLAANRIAHGLDRRTGS
jgi:peptide/nickel transport system permease protein